MKILMLISLCLFVSCGKAKTVTIEKEKIVEVESEKSRLENVECRSDGSYTECAILNVAVKILFINPRKDEDCIKGTDYYLLDEKTLVTRNGCKANFLLEVE